DCLPEGPVPDPECLEEPVERDALVDPASSGLAGEGKVGAPRISPRPERLHQQVDVQPAVLADIVEKGLTARPIIRADLAEDRRQHALRELVLAPLARGEDPLDLLGNAGRPAGNPQLHPGEPIRTCSYRQVGSDKFVRPPNELSPARA